jgi:acylphosphatase
VRVVCEGNATALAEFTRWLEQGPPSGRVARVEKRLKDYRGIYRTFTVE